MPHRRRRVTTAFRVATPRGGIAHFAPGDTLAVRGVDGRVYRVTAQGHGTLTVPVWKIHTFTTEDAGEGG